MVWASCMRTGRAHRTSTARALSTATEGLGPKHLVVQANGLFGHAGNWDVVNKCLREKLQNEDHYLIFPSQVNTKRATFQGIDVCGERLAAEVVEVVEAHPSLLYITFMGHSMGGLMLRYAAGKLYDPRSHRIAGLEPVHFITLATPHLGCDATGVSQVPFIGWLQAIPLVGRFVHVLLNSLAVPVASTLFRTSGRQFFMADIPREPRKRKQRGPLLSHALSVPSVVSDDDEIAGPAASSAPSAGPPNNASNGRGASEQSEQDSSEQLGTSPIEAAMVTGAPLLLVMAHDVQGRGYFFSALKAFQTRTCYANVGNDHLVGWANSSLRFATQLPDLRLKDRTSTLRAKGVVREDPIEAGFSPHLLQAAQASSATSQPYASSTAPPVTIPEVAANGDTPSAQLQQRGAVATMSPLAAAPASAASPSNGSQHEPLLHHAASTQGTATAARGASQHGADSPCTPLNGGPRSGAAADVKSVDAARSSQGGAVSGTGRAGAGEDAWPRHRRRSSDGSDFDAGDHHVEQALEHPELDLPARPRPIDSILSSSKAEKTSHILHKLQTLPWSRVDCSWRDIIFKIFAHNQIQATRWWLNWEGKPACQHLATRFIQMEVRLAACQADYHCGVVEVTEPVSGR